MDVAGLALKSVRGRPGHVLLAPRKTDKLAQRIVRNGEIFRGWCCSTCCPTIRELSGRLVDTSLPLSRLSVADVARHAQRSGLVGRISDSTVWRWLHEDAIRPWQHRCWILPRDPHFQAKAGRILNLYERHWQGQSLREDKFVISTDEKTSIQARLRTHPSLPTEPGKTMRVEHEYVRGGAWAYLAALDVHRAKVFGRCEATTGIVPFERLVDQVMSQAPYNTARRVFWVMDNGSSHRGEASVRRLTQAHPRLVPVHGPVHASWLNQIEIYFSIIECKVLTPNDFPSLQAVAERLANFESYFGSFAHPFKLTREPCHQAQLAQDISVRRAVLPPRHPHNRSAAF